MSVDAKPYAMPRPLRGSSVLYYVHGTRGSDAEVGFIQRIGASAVVIQLGSGVVVDGVRHVDDPRLAQGSHHRENGAWDYTEDTKVIADLMCRVKALESKPQEKDTDKGCEKNPSNESGGSIAEVPAKKVHWKTKVKEAILE